MIHYSTDYVYDGSKPTPYEETRRHRPAERLWPRPSWRAIRPSRPAAVLTSSCAPRGCTTFAARTFCAPCFDWRAKRKNCASSATSTARPPGHAAWPRRPPSFWPVLEHKSETSGSWPTGIFHLTAGGQTSWAGFARSHPGGLRCFCSCLGGSLASSDAPLTGADAWFSITTEEYPTPARRPRNSVLSNAQGAGGFRHQYARLARTTAACHAGRHSLIILSLHGCNKLYPGLRAWSPRLSQNPLAEGARKILCFALFRSMNGDL